MKKFYLVVSVFLVSLFLFPASSGAAADISQLQQIINVNVSGNGDSSVPAKLRLVVNQTGPVTYKSFVLPNPSRLVIDLSNTWIDASNAKLIQVNNEVVNQVRVHQNRPDTVRIVLDLENNVSADDYRITTSQDENNKSGRLVLDVGRIDQSAGNQPTSKTTKQATPPVLPSAPPAAFPEPKPIKFFDTPGIAGKVITLDPGHGGSDPGAIGPNKTMEANVALTVATELRKLLEQNGAKVVMTRSSDRDVFGPNASATQELQARCDIANQAKADLFLSIHANAFSNKNVGGTATYHYPKTTGDIRVAAYVQSELLKQTGLQDRGNNPARFYVLKHTDMPSALIELAFVSNPVEEKLLNDNNFIKKMALGIYNGLVKYFTVTE